MREIDYPRSADVRLGFDGESRRVWVEDGVGRRAYTYDAWGRVRRQKGCCQSEPGIDVVAVEAAYDGAGRRTELREITQGGIPCVRYTFYDGLGRVRAVGLTNFPQVGNVLYHYDSAGRLWKEQFPNSTYLVHTYYGEETPDQRGRRKSLQLCVGDCTAVDAEGNPLGTSVLGYEYRCDRLGRVVWSRELPSGDETEYVYSPAGRLVYEAREGDVGYMRFYTYQLDGSREMVYRVDNRFGLCWDWYCYDVVSGRLASVQDMWTGEANSFVWNPEGTLARWEAPGASYAQVFWYDEEGRLVRIERDYGGGNLQLAYRYGYNSDGVRVWKQDVLLQQEYRYLCRIGCGGVPRRVYSRAVNRDS